VAGSAEQCWRRGPAETAGAAAVAVAAAADAYSAAVVYFVVVAGPLAAGARVLVAGAERREPCELVVVEGEHQAPF